ncbi:SPOR domain-containing protein [Robiginitalea sp. SC105]|uniref:SPOR domain-containing protein n=1 Tax=Robiginitalea sp. SC105 TaxID=2762332 RepID=UPI00163AD78F|nr:SPOR domain-containing protein [Robiginitalea sp. SC105]MBC2838756.1 SPOR domain-containing protein [Robiginitalea sp. SC105]
MRNRLAILTLFLSAAAGLHAQSGRISIEQDPEIGKLLQIYTQSNSEADFYTIQVGFGNYSFAEELKGDVEQEFPKWTAKIVFDSPTYRVQVGRFRERLEAEREFAEVRKKFPGALLLRPGDREN